MAVYDVDEELKLDTRFELNVKGMSRFSSPNIQGTITARAGGTASESIYMYCVLTMMSIEPQVIRFNFCQ